MHTEEWKALLLCLFAGMRRNEADKLRWRSIDFDAGVVRIETQDDFAPKAETSLGEVPIDQELVAILRGLRAREPKAVTCHWGHEQPGAGWNDTGGEDVTRLAAWYGQGVNHRTLAHLAQRSGFLVARRRACSRSRFLRHADVPYGPTTPFKRSAHGGWAGCWWKPLQRS